MGKAERKRWADNVKAMEIVAKDRSEITDEDIRFLRENYTSVGGEVEWKRANGTVELRSTWDFDWQDEIVAEWRRLGDNDSF